jgi:foldase protein PrsA
VTKRILAVLVVLLLAGAVGLVAGCGGDLPKSAVAKVGDNVITQKAFDQKVADFEAQYAGQIPDKTTDPDTYKAFQQDVLEYMVTYAMASQKAEELKLAVTDEEVQKEIDSILQQSFAGDQAKFDDALKQQGMTVEQLKQSYKESMLLQKVYDEVTKDSTTVPDTDIQAYYDAHKTEYFVDETRTARHILIAPDPLRVDGTTSTTSTSSTTSTTAGSSTTAGPSTTAGSSTSTASSSTTTTAKPTDADWNAALETANKVRADLVAGADWTAEAAKYSDDPGSKEKGGDLGTISKGEMVKEFEDAVFSLKKDEISQPVKTAYGYHVIQVTGITEAKQYTLDEVKEDIKSSLVSAKKSEAWRSWIEKQKAAAGVIYASNWTPSTTTTAAPTPTTSGAGDTTTTVAPSAQTTTTAGATITTAAPTTTTAKP